MPPRPLRLLLLAVLLAITLYWLGTYHPPQLELSNRFNDVLPKLCPTAASGIVPPIATPKADVRYIFAFGDSFTESDFDILHDRPNRTQPFGRPDIGHTTVGGPTWLHYLINTLKPSIPTLVYNFAVGGSVIDNDVFAIPMELRGPDFRLQVATFQAHLVAHRDFADWNAENSVAIVWYGANDVNWVRLLAEEKGKEKDPEELFAEDARSALRQVHLLYLYGVRRFILMTTPSLWRTIFFSFEPPGAIARLVTSFNDQLRRHANDWSNTARGNVSLTILDTVPIWDTVLDSPLRYGAPNATCEALLSYLQEDGGNGCLWQDKFHPGRAMNLETAKAVKAALDESGFWSGSGMEQHL